MPKRKRTDHEIMAEDGISKITIFQTLEAGYEEYAKLLMSDLPLNQRISARFCFFAGAQVFYNMIAFPLGCAGSAEEGSQVLIKALDQAQKELMAYAEEARRLQAEYAGETIN